MSPGEVLIQVSIVFSTIALFIIGITFAVNLLTFPKLEIPGELFLPRHPLVSILIPARNEAAKISATITDLLAQTYPHFEIMVLDDQSTDQTSAVVLTAAKNNPRVKLLPGENMPEGWSGKNWACHQLSQTASGELLIFTDSDVRWQPGALAALLTLFAHHDADLLTIWPSQITTSLAERLTVPLLATVILGYLPLPAVHHLSFPGFAAANGQCLLFTKVAYSRIGGHASVKNSIVEDIDLARRIKKSRLKLCMADGNNLISCQMYSSWAEVSSGFAKNILAGHANSPLLLALSTIFHWSLYILPWIWLLFPSAAPDFSPLWPYAPLCLIGVGLLIRAGSAAFTHQRIQDAILTPVSVLLFTLIAARAIWWKWRYGGPVWKGRIISMNSPKPKAAPGETRERSHEFDSR